MTGFRTDGIPVTVDGVPLHRKDVEAALGQGKAGPAGFRRELYGFLSRWFDGTDAIEANTSGSTGAPRAMRAEKRRMAASAELTCSTLGLKPGDTALLCMPLGYIAGMMMVVRAWSRGLDLLVATPSRNPLRGLRQAPDFAAMVPLQVHESLGNPGERALLEGIGNLIIGGGPIDGDLERRLSGFPNAVWSTYGMTETLSHIALRRLNGPGASPMYTPMEGVRVRVGERGTLVVSAPRVCPGELVTNDLARVDGDGRFLILGRADNTIISGGVKIQAEMVERALEGCLGVPFMVTSVPDATYGEAVALLLEGDAPVDVGAALERALPPYWRPRRVVTVPLLPRTETGKPDRAAARRMAFGGMIPPRAGTGK